VAEKARRSLSILPEKKEAKRSARDEGDKDDGR
jgi:hypothetical protein